MNKILIIKYGALGDVLRTSYILKGLHEKYGEARIFWLTADRSVDLLRYNPRIFEIVTPNMNYGLLRETMYDLVISLDDEREILAGVADLNYRKLVGACLIDGAPDYTPEAAEWFDMGLISRFGKEQADFLKKNNRREHNQILAAMLDIAVDGPEFFNSPVVEARMARMFDREFFSIGLNSGAGGRWVAKQLPLGETVALVEKLLDLEVGGKKTRVYLMGGEEERQRHGEIVSRISSDRVRDAGNDNSLPEFAAIIRHCDYVITSDSLALHLAIAQRVKNLSFYAPTSAAEIGTFRTGVKVISRAVDYCSYRKDADNSTITAERIIENFSEHVKEQQGTE